MNKNIILGAFLASLSLFSTKVLAQSVGVGTASPSSNAALHVSQGAQPQGLLIPKMSGADMLTLQGSLASPADLGMVIYNLDSAAFLYWNGAGFQHFGQGTTIAINTGTGLTGGPVGATGTISLSNTAVTAGSYGGATEVPVLDIDAQGRVTGASTATISGVPSGGSGTDYLAGDGSWVGFSSAVRNELSATAPLVYDDINGVISLDNSGVTTGSYGSTTEIPVITVDASGRVTAASTATIPAALPSGGTGTDYLAGDNSWADFTSAARSSISGFSPLSYNSSTGVMSLSTSGVTAGTYGSGAQIAQFTVDAQGRITSATNITAPSSPWVTAAADAYFTGGNIAIGTNSPDTYTFEVVGTTGLANTEVAGTFDVTGGLTSLGNLDVVGTMAFDGSVQWNDAAFATGSSGLLLASGTGTMSKLDFTGAGSSFLMDDGTWGTVSGDDMGDHTATTNIILGNNYLSGDGGPEGILIDAAGNVSIGGATDSNYKLYVYGKLKSDGITEMSDRRLKKDITTLTGSLEKIQALRGVTYLWNQDNEANIEFATDQQIGLIAQEVEEVFPELVDTDAEGFKSVEYSKLVAVLIEALKEQQKTIDGLETQIGGLNELKAEVEILKSNMSKYSMK